MPITDKCQGFALSRQTDFPNSKPKKEKPVKFVYMVLLTHQGSVYMYQRPATGIWGGLYSYPEFESLDDFEHFLNQHTTGVAMEELIFDESKMFRHTFSHYHLDIQPIRIELQQKVPTIEQGKDVWFQFGDQDLSSGAKIVNKQEFGKSAVTEKLLAQLKAGAFNDC